MKGEFSIPTTTFTDERPDPLLSPDLNRIPPDFHHIHLLGICGTGMASLAGLLKEKGYQVTGSDQNIYPPMSHLLEILSIPVMEGYSRANLTPPPDLVVVGNVVTRYNPEALEISRLGLPYISFPQAIKHFALKNKRSVVIGGTHGKTTVAALAAWTLERAGMHPGFMIGGIPLNFEKSFQWGKGRYFVIEGDEYDTAFFDKGPKFLHYQPWILILTSIEFDHADIYRNLEHVIQSFSRLIRLMPPEGLLIANGDDPVIARLIKEAPCRVNTYGLEGDVLFKAVGISVQRKFTRLKVLRAGKEYLNLRTPLYGRHNIYNLLSVVLLAHSLRIPRQGLVESQTGFKGVKRRQQILGQRNGIAVLDDFAHHPTAVRETIRAVREKYRDRRLIAVFEPRSNSSRRNVFQARYASSFGEADLIMIPEPPLMDKIPEQERFSSQTLVKDLKKRGLKAQYFPATDRLLDALVKESRPGDVILIMSNGAFDNLHQRLLQRI